MRRILILVLALLPALAGAETLKLDQSSPLATVRSWLAAAEAGDKEKALGLGTAEWAAQENGWDSSFTTAIFGKGYRIKTANIREPEVTGDSARVSVGAVFLAEGEEDNEGLNFLLELREGRWAITDLR